MQPRKFLEVRDPARLRELIRDRGFTYAHVARFAGLRSRQFMHALATGSKTRCSPRIAKRIAEVLQVPVDDLFVDAVSFRERRIAASQQTGRAA